MADDFGGFAHTVRGDASLSHLKTYREHAPPTHKITIQDRRRKVEKTINEEKKNVGSRKHSKFYKRDRRIQNEIKTGADEISFIASKTKRGAVG